MPHAVHNFQSSEVSVSGNLNPRILLIERIFYWFSKASVISFLFRFIIEI